MENTCSLRDTLLTLARCTVLAIVVARSISSLACTGFPFCICIACVLAERSRSALQAFLSRRAHGRPRLAAPQHRSRRAGAPSPRALAAPLTNDCWYCILVVIFRSPPDGRSRLGGTRQVEACAVLSGRPRTPDRNARWPVAIPP
eukprot:6196925-Pleurochrysis_carterae.AAC.1